MDSRILLISSKHLLRVLAVTQELAQSDLPSIKSSSS